jgi:putative endonuclease
LSWTGPRGEDEACQHLLDLGMTVVARNHRGERNEVDLVMLDGDVLVFVEVRTRSDPDRGTALETIDGRKRARVVAGARDYLAKNPWGGAVRFDVVGITGEGESRQIEHIADAFGVGE